MSKNIEVVQSIDDISRLLTSGFDEWKSLGEVNVKHNNELTLFNYTAKAQYEARWNFFETVSRGLILNNVTGRIVARPFEKFFNWGEGGRTTDAPIDYVMEKLDGSLGIMYEHEGEFKIATRGSFDSDQAIWATEFIQSKKRHPKDTVGEYTLLFEIIYPDNRIVVDYGQREDLVLLALRHNPTGAYSRLPQHK